MNASEEMCTKNFGSLLRREMGHHRFLTHIHKWQNIVQRPFLGVYDSFVSQNLLKDGTYVPPIIYDKGLTPLLVRFAAWRPKLVSWDAAVRARGHSLDIAVRFNGVARLLPQAWDRLKVIADVETYLATRRLPASRTSRSLRPLTVGDLSFATGSTWFAGLGRRSTHLDGGYQDAHAHQCRRIAVDLKSRDECLPLLGRGLLCGLGNAVT